MSAVVPNTPLVAMFAPRVVRWSQRNGVNASRYLMPLSFASMLGGVITLIGTSTNLVVSDLLSQAGEEPLGVFEITVVGLPVAIVGVIVLSTIGARLLPERIARGTDVERRAREFQMAARVDPDGPIVGRTVADSGSAGLDGAFLALIERPGADERRRRRSRHRRTRCWRPATCAVSSATSAAMIDLHEIAGLTNLERSHTRGRRRAGHAGVRSGRVAGVRGWSVRR